MKKYQSVYDRFGYSLDQEKLWEAFCKFIKDEFFSSFQPICKPSLYDYFDKLDKISDEINRKIARATCDANSFDDDRIYENKKILKLVNTLFSYDRFYGINVNYIIYLQIIFDILFGYKILKKNYAVFLYEISEYFDDFPQLGLALKIYKTKSAQIFPLISQASNEKINNTLNTLETKQYKKTIALFEAGMKEFISAKDILGSKNVVEDMRGACDEIIKETLNDKNKGMKSIFGEPEVFGLSPSQKKIFDEFMGMMDDIKHGKYDPTKKDVILIVGLTVDFIDFISATDVKSKQVKSSKK